MGGVRTTGRIGQGGGVHRPGGKVVETYLGPCLGFTNYGLNNRLSTLYYAIVYVTSVILRYTLLFRLAYQVAPEFRRTIKRLIGSFRNRLITGHVRFGYKSEVINNRKELDKRTSF